MHKFVHKITILMILGGIRLHFQSENCKIWREGSDVELPRARQIS